MLFGEREIDPKLSSPTWSWETSVHLSEELIWYAKPDASPVGILLGRLLFDSSFLYVQSGKEYFCNKIILTLIILYQAIHYAPICPHSLNTSTVMRDKNHHLIWIVFGIVSLYIKKRQHIEHNSKCAVVPSWSYR